MWAGPAHNLFGDNPMSPNTIAVTNLQTRLISSHVRTLKRVLTQTQKQNRNLRTSIKFAEPPPPRKWNCWSNFPLTRLRNAGSAFHEPLGTVRGLSDCCLSWSGWCPGGLIPQGSPITASITTQFSSILCFGVFHRIRINEKGPTYGCLSNRRKEPPLEEIIQRNF